MMKFTNLSPALACALLSTALIRAGEGPKGRGAEGAVYTMDNSTGGNHVVILSRRSDGTLFPGGIESTGGLGTGAGLGSQGSLLLSSDAHWLFACNAGSDEITVFEVTSKGLHRTARQASGGRTPISLTMHDDLVYVLNAGGASGDQDKITGFHFAHGQLTQLPGAASSLSAADTGPAEVSFTSDGDVLVVTEKNLNRIETFPLNHRGLPEGHNVFASPAAVPFGFSAGRHDRIYVSNAASSSLSSYQLSEDGDVEAISDSVPNHQMAACWVALTRNNRFAYTANAASGSISGYRVDRHGEVALLDADGQTGLTGDGSHPIDMALSDGDRFLYCLNSGNGTISAFAIQANGGLRSLGTVPGLAASVAGLAAQ